MASALQFAIFQLIHQAQTISRNVFHTANIPHVLFFAFSSSLVNQESSLISVT